ncbi:MAG: Rpn family recombination-promoting nuclease/putative transposase [Holosporales bacterium]|jgi:predicted transposase/invertase (TIGR01784 family)|nr:Rpn family recombination-promoting nuclease/putative transposase [Holosporales bacterium]
MKAEKSDLKVLPTNDIIFKMIFANPRDTRPLIHFLNCAIKPESPIKSVVITSNEPSKDYRSEKGVRMDIVATTDAGEQIDVEMQRKNNLDIKGRALFYWSKLFGGQLEMGADYHNLNRTVSITIMNFTLFHADKRYWRKAYLKDDVSNEVITNLLEMQFIELNKMKKMDQNSPLTFWIEFLKDRATCKISGGVRASTDFHLTRECYL